MAKRTTKKRSTRITRGASKKTLDDIHYGPEPDVDYFEDHLIHDFFNWYNYMWDRNKSMLVLISYAKKFGYKNAGKFKKMMVPPTLAYIAQGLERGLKFPDHKNYPDEGSTGWQKHLHEELRKYNKKAHNLYNVYLGQELVDPEKVVKKRKTVQEHIDAKVQSILGEVDHAIDVWDVEPFDMYKYLTGLKISAVVAKKIPEQYQELLNEVKEAREGKSKQLKEGYSHMTKIEK